MLARDHQVLILAMVYPHTNVDIVLICPPSQPRIIHFYVPFHEDSSTYKPRPPYTLALELSISSSTFPS